MGETTAAAAARTRANRLELVDRIGRALTQSGMVWPQPGLLFFRFEHQAAPIYGVIEPSLCVIAQGSKDVTLGGRSYRYDPYHYFITTVGLPATSRIVRASADRPFLGLHLTLDPVIVTSVLAEAGAQGRGSGGPARAMAVSSVDADLLDAIVRLVRLINDPRQYRFIAPLITREIVYRLLAGEQAGRLMHLARLGGQGRRVVDAIDQLRRGFDKPLRIEAIARATGMSRSAFHARFKAITGISPLQFQKELRLQEARRLMLADHLDAGEAGFRVGYEDSSHFSRDYKRHFGQPPVRDIERLRNGAKPAGAKPAGRRRPRT